MTQALQPVPPVAARRGARLVFAFVLLVVAALTTVAGLLGPASDVATNLTIVAWVITLFAPFLPYGFRPVLDGTGLTAWTVSGRRTVALDRLTRVGRLWFPAPPRELDVLVLRDTNGIRLIVNVPAVDDAVFASVTDPECAEPRVAAGAGYRLGLIELGFGRRFLRGLGAVLLGLLYTGLTLVALIVVEALIHTILNDQ
jgi:hypothetical protein